MANLHNRPHAREQDPGRQYLHQQDVGRRDKDTACSRHQDHGSRIPVTDAIQSLCLAGALGRLEGVGLANVDVSSRLSSTATSAPQESLYTEYPAIPSRHHHRHVSFLPRTTTLLPPHAGIPVADALPRPTTSRPNRISSPSPPYGRLSLLCISSHPCPSIKETLKGRHPINPPPTTKTISTSTTTTTAISLRPRSTRNPSPPTSKNGLPNRHNQPLNPIPPTKQTTSASLPLPLPPGPKPLAILPHNPPTHLPHKPNLPLRRLPPLPLLPKLKLQLPFALRRLCPPPTHATTCLGRKQRWVRLGVFLAIQVPYESVFAVCPRSAGTDDSSAVCPTANAVEYVADADGGIVVSAFGVTWLEWSEEGCSFLSRV
jgi:hypothetical protein